MCDILCSLGYEVLLASSCEQALEQLDAHDNHADLLLVDLNLLSSSGFEVWGSFPAAPALL